MPIYVKLSSETTYENWAIIELQGDIQAHSGTITGTQFVGDLHFTKTGTTVLIIGHHLLHGKEAKFDKPLAVLEKSKTNDGQTEYLVKAIITKKLLFKTRPKPIIVD